jgi:hypothetical protein
MMPAAAPWSLLLQSLHKRRPVTVTSGSPRIIRSHSSHWKRMMVAAVLILDGWDHETLAA